MWRDVGSQLRHFRQHARRASNCAMISVLNANSDSICDEFPAHTAGYLPSRWRRILQAAALWELGRVPALIKVQYCLNFPGSTPNLLNNLIC